jgi:antirestriction protein ArdC
MNKIYQEVTTRIISELIAGVPPWVKPWAETPGLNLPVNAITGKAYRGVNVFLLWIARSNGWPTPRFLTYRQAQEVGGQVRKGEHGIRICKFGDWTPKKGAPGDGEDEARIPFLKHYAVFNIQQCEGLPAEISDSPPPKPRHHDGRDPLIEEFISAIGAVVREDGNQASYFITKDYIAVPPFNTFASGALFYATLFHELGHWTGAKHRLDRDIAFAKRFPPEHRHAAEELVAELTAAFLCAEFSVNSGTEHSTYLGGYIRMLQADPKAVFTCASAAQKAVDLLRELVLREPAQAAE